MKYKYLLLIMLPAAILFMSCSNSLVYSPALNLPVKPIAKENIDFSGGVELLPETRPGEEVSDNFEIPNEPDPDDERYGNNTFGYNFQLGYGFSDNFNLYIRGWGDLEYTGEYFRSGYALSSTLTLTDISGSTRLMIIPRIGLAIDGNYIGGYGLGMSSAIHHRFTDNFAFYSGLGFVWGFSEMGTIQDGENGIGIIGNVGTAYEIFDSFRINLELSPIYQINLYDDKQQFVISGQFTIGYMIR
jgi:hypothetical protein